MGTVPWEKVMRALKEIGYEGDFTYEIGGFFNSIPKELLLPAAKLSVATGRHLISKIKD